MGGGTPGAPPNICAKASGLLRVAMPAPGLGGPKSPAGDDATCPHLPASSQACDVYARAFGTCALENAHVYAIGGQDNNGLMDKVHYAYA